MVMIERSYMRVVEDHFDEDRQMLFVSGPRQVGKTTLCQLVGESYGTHAYMSWDDVDDRTTILQGPSAVAAECGLDELSGDSRLVTLDEFHKAPDWKSFLKGFYDTYGQRADILVTGSGKLDVFRSGGESLMGRYFPYRMHPLSTAELARSKRSESTIQDPSDIGSDAFEGLIRFGGFPEPYSKGSEEFHNRWRRLRTDQLIREEVADLTRIRQLDQLEVLAQLVASRTGQLINYSSLAKDIRVAVDTIRRWLQTLRSLYYCFRVRPWHKNVARSLRKQPTYYLWDWSSLDDRAARYENLVASALLKATHYWTDSGEGDFGLHYLRDKQKREVDFVVVRDGQPWFLVEVKSSSNASLSKNLAYFQQQVGARHAFQVVFDLEHVDRDCFEEEQPIKVPAQTFLSQLV